MIKEKKRVTPYLWHIVKIQKGFKLIRHECDLFLEQILHSDCPVEARSIFVSFQAVCGNKYGHNGFLVPDHLLYAFHSFKKSLVVTLCYLEVTSCELHLTQTDETVIPIDNQVNIRIGRDVPWRFPRYHPVNSQGVLDLPDVSPAQVLESKTHP